MTALDRYVRLESDALWREAPDAQRRDVVISFGNATLVISDQAGRPLTHWSLTALNRLNPSVRPAVYSPDEAESELLEISDTTMVDAIEEVRRALAKARPHPGKLRLWLTLGGIVALLLAAVIWLPDALSRQTLAIVPETKRTEIGTIMLSHMEATTGEVCRSSRSDAAADRLAKRVFGSENEVQIAVVPQLTAGATGLPGGLLIIDQSVLQHVDDPAAAAGFLVAAHAATLPGACSATVNPLTSGFPVLSKANSKREKTTPFCEREVGWRRIKGIRPRALRG